MRTIFAEYNPQRNSVDVYTSASYMLRIDCWEAEKNLKTTPGSDCAFSVLPPYPLPLFFFLIGRPPFRNKSVADSESKYYGRHSYIMLIFQNTND